MEWVQGVGGLRLRDRVRNLCPGQILCNVTGSWHGMFWISFTHDPLTRKCCNSVERLHGWMRFSRPSGITEGLLGKLCCTWKKEHQWDALCCVSVSGPHFKFISTSVLLSFQCSLMHYVMYLMYLCVRHFLSFIFTSIKTRMESYKTALCPPLLISSAII